MSFTYSPNAEISGSHLVTTLDSDVGSKIATSFEACEGCFNTSKGYDGKEYRFVDEDGQLYNVYSRWGIWRLGGYNLQPGDVGAFVNWVRSLR